MNEGNTPIPIIDLFSGPGGLGEGFMALRDEYGNRAFKILMSVERDPNAHKTLRLRSFYRRILDKNKGKAPKEYIEYTLDPSEKNFDKLTAKYANEYKQAEDETLCEALEEGNDAHVNEALKRLENYPNSPTVLIGGPPCQAYSLVGRARRTNEDRESFENDERQTLYRCYLRFIEKIQPDIFVMENVKGMLSATRKSQKIFSLIKGDMEALGYQLHSLSTESPSSPLDYLIKSEKYGIPQARHRVILVGTKISKRTEIACLKPQKMTTVNDAIGDLPKLGGEFSRRNHPGFSSRNKFLSEAQERLLSAVRDDKVKEYLETLVFDENERPIKSSTKLEKPSIYQRWYEGGFKKQTIVLNHDTRAHMAKDYERYLFASAFTQVHDRSANLYDFPTYLLPEHKNVLGIESGKEIIFPDRFRVQVSNKPSTTVTAHISKDGHYFIHPDASQARSLTVREAARLQTFPDDYYFEGGRTSAFQQVGNAVPPLLANQIAKILIDNLNTNS
ncbi:hypothetical protein BSR28_01780 [Boudabousia liubingyangii]|nr:hypothetical protein BSR28_01780 [Boudabousia liubingyangii]